MENTQTTNTQPVAPTKPKSSNPMFLIIGFIIFIALAAVFAAVYISNNRTKPSQVSDNTQTLKRSESRMEKPTPTPATIQEEFESITIDDASNDLKDVGADVNAL